jgi:hypothetical protein
MVTQRGARLRFRSGAAAPEGTYGSAGRTYGEPGWTYGQAATDPTDTRYDVTAFPGWGPRTPDWEYRQWDITPVMEMVLLAEGGAPIDYASILSAELILTLTTYGAYTYQPAYPLVVNADRLTRVWETGDLLVPGRYRVIVKMVFDSGRTLTVPSSDDGALIVRDGSQP